MVNYLDLLWRDAMRHVILLLVVTLVGCGERAKEVGEEVTEATDDDEPSPASSGRVSSS